MLVAFEEHMMQEVIPRDSLERHMMQEACSVGSLEEQMTLVEKISPVSPLDDGSWIDCIMVAYIAACVYA
jgi:hypothetical protein